MPTSTPMPTKAVGDIFTTTLWNNYLRDNLNKLLNSGHRTLTVAQFSALTGLEGTKGTVAGDEVYLEVDATAGVLWHLVYESTEATYKWRYLGGPALCLFVTAVETRTNAAYGALTTPGPSVTLPRAGDYRVDLAASLRNNTIAASTYMSYDIGGTGAVDGDALVVNSPANYGCGSASMRPNVKTGLATVTLTSKYRSDSSSTAEFANRAMFVVPNRIRHDA